MNRIFCLMLFLCPYLIKAQKPIAIGQKLPAKYLRQLQTLNPAANPSLYIIDFWATYCTSCHKNFPNMAALQSEFKGKLQVTLINSARTMDKPQEIESFFQQYYTVHPQESPFLYIHNDKNFTNLFPFISIPQYVWLDASGLVKAITGSEEVTSQNIQSVLKGAPISLPDRSILQRLNPVKSLFFPNANPDSLADGIFSKGDTLFYPFLSNYYRFKDAKIRRIIAINYPLLSVYQNCLEFKSNQMQLLIPEDHPTLTTPVNFEFSAPAALSDKEFNAQMLEAINKCFGLDAGIKTIPFKALAIKVKDSVTFLKQQTEASSGKQIQGDGQNDFRKETLSGIIEQLNSRVLRFAARPILIDETGIQGKVFLQLHKDAYRGNLQSLINSLQIFGLRLEPVIRPLPVFILSTSSNN